MISVAKVRLTALWLIVILLSACSTDEKVEPIRLHGSTMGTTYNVTLPELPDGLSQDDVQQQLDALLLEVNQEMSTYQADSVISSFNRSTLTDWFPVSAQFVRVSQTALELSRLTDGAYDITVGPLIELWGFGAKNKSEDDIPEASAITSAKARVGYEKLSLQTEPFAIRKSVADVSIDLSSIAKGYGVDVLAMYLDQLHVKHYLVEIGGELRTRGKNHRNEPWQIAIEKPIVGGRDVQRILGLYDVGVATSGDYRNYFEKDGIRYSHMIDAATGSPITHSLASVTVLADTAMLADGWATALMLLGEKNGYELAKTENLAAYFIYKHDDQFLTRETPEFTRLIETND